MIKKFLSATLFGFLMLGLAGTFVACDDYDDSDLRRRVEAIEGTLSDLQAQIAEGVVITDISSSENGITITTSDGGTYTVTNGTNGAPGSVVEIGENGNWFIDGVDTGMPSRGEDGQDGQDGEDGKDGQANGNMVYYEPDMESGCWAKVVCNSDGEEESRVVMNGENGTEKMPWKAEGGIITAVYNTENQTLTLTNIEDADGNLTDVTIKLSEPLNGLLFIPDVIKEGHGVTTYYSLSVWDNTSKTYKFLASNDLVMTYRLNPKNADTTNLKEPAAWSFINRTVEVRSAKPDENNFLEVTNISFAEAGKVTVTSVASKELADASNSKTDNKEVLVALQANDKTVDGKDRIVTSDYSIVDFETLNDFAIAKKHKLPLADADRYYPETFGTVTDATTVDANMVYTGELNLNTLAEAWATSETHISLVDAGFGKYLTYKFEETKIKGTDGTEQDYYTSIEQKEDGNYYISVDDAADGEPNEAAISRKPVVKATAYLNGEEIAVGYIVIQITRTAQVNPDPIEITKEGGDIMYSTLPDSPAWSTSSNNTIVFTWQEVNDQIYSVVGIPAEDFALRYDQANTTYKITNYDGVTDNGVSVTIRPFNSNATLTDGLVYVQFNDLADIEEGLKDGAGKVEVVIPAFDPTSYPEIHITINYNIHDDCTEAQLIDDYATNKTQIVRGQVIGGNLTMQTRLVEAFVDYLDGFANKHHTYYFALASSAPTTYVEIDPVNPAASAQTFADQIIKLTQELTTKSLDVPVRFVAVRDCGTNHYLDYTVQFRNPFIIEVETPVELETPVGLATTDDFADRIKVFFEVGHKLVWEHKQGNELFDEYFDSDSKFEFTYAIKAGEDQNGRLTIDSTTGLITWSNDGSGLYNDITVHVIVTLNVDGVGTISEEIPVTLKKTEGM